MKFSSVLLFALLAACVVSTSADVAEQSLAEVQTYSEVNTENTLSVGNAQTTEGSAAVVSQPPLLISSAPAPQPLAPANSGPLVISAPARAQPAPPAPRKLISSRPNPQAAPPKVITTSKSNTVGNRFGYPKTTSTTTTTKQVYPGGRGFKTTTTSTKSYTDKQYIVNGQHKDPKTVDLQLEKEWNSLKEDMEKFDREMNSRMRKLHERVRHLNPRSQKVK